MSYWEERILREEHKAQRIAKNYLKKEKQFYKDAIATLESEINALYAQIQTQGIESLTRTQLWQYSHYQKLKGQISEQALRIGKSQVSFTEQLIDEVFEKTLETPLQDTAATTIAAISPQQPKYLLNSAWSGKNYSSRIYTNANQLAARLEKSLTDLLVLGRTPDELKKELITEMGISYRQADRLMRTEASYAFNTASIERYKRYGANKVELLIEHDACDDCQELKGKQYEVNAVPFLPVHPNCRCCYIPVI